MNEIKYNFSKEKKKLYHYILVELEIQRDCISSINKFVIKKYKNNKNNLFNGSIQTRPIWVNSSPIKFWLIELSQWIWLCAYVLEVGSVRPKLRLVGLKLRPSLSIWFFRPVWISPMMRSMYMQLFKFCSLRNDGKY